ncbi:hypothetical protein NA57DRAFT_51410 [Rhizodiscina lignyota]|uniref:Microbial-type PARG catalytic domain-containing protein n=1 Tax=Rhizodiscina lignyota TaxID=1504668 RepID=A0A9P4MEL5_9PEZI|nr:hypothetical protein NA57DRAFT_51410 [Rhizodiscina lignyota]
MQLKISSYFQGDNFSEKGERRKPPEVPPPKDDTKYLSDEKSKLKARLKLVGEETRVAYADCERYSPRVKAAYLRTYMTKRCAQIPFVPKRQDYTIISVIDADTLDATMALQEEFPNASIGVLNMASDKYVGGGFLTGAPAQEESLCRRSTLWPCLMGVKDQFYPIPATSVLVSPDVFVFRTGFEDNFRILPWSECFFIRIISVAAIYKPRIQNGRFENHADRQLTATKVRETLRAAFHAGCNVLVLGALGCGAFKNPPRAIAEIFRDVLNESEFLVAFERIIFAILDSKKVTYGASTNNYEIFRQVLVPRDENTEKEAS